MGWCVAGTSGRWAGGFVLDGAPAGRGGGIRVAAKPTTCAARAPCRRHIPSAVAHLLRLHEKGGKRYDVPAHHRAEAAVDAYLVASGIEDAKAPLFQSVDRSRRLSGRSLTRRVVLAMIKRRSAAAGLPASTCCHTFRATGITAYLSNGGTLEHAQQIAGHASPRTTKLYDRTADTVTLDEIERIVI